MSVYRWACLILECAEEWQKDPESKGLSLVARMLREAEQAKQVLRDKGYGVTGTGLLETANEVPSLEEIET